MTPLVALTTVHGSFAAHVLAARLGCEGIDVELRGAVGGPYGLTVGDLARVDLYVPAEDLDDARLVLLAAEIDEALALPDPAADVSPGRSLWVWAAAFVLAAAAVGTPILRLLGE